MPQVRRAVLAAIPLIAALLLSQLGCGLINIQAQDSTRSSDQLILPAVATPTAEAHDLAITAIDFDPALRSNSLLASDNITLLVAVENRGNQVEKDAIVEATLFGLPDSDVLVSSQGMVKEIVPGESQVARFSNFSSIPLRSAYSLKVEVSPVPGEIFLGNNSRTYKLEVTVSSR